MGRPRERWVSRLGILVVKIPRATSPKAISRCFQALLRLYNPLNLTLRKAASESEWGRCEEQPFRLFEAPPLLGEAFRNADGRLRAAGYGGPYIDERFPPVV